LQSAQKSEKLLEGFRVLDLTDDKGIICGRSLGGWGADVIKIERPGGDQIRRIGPFVNDTYDPENSIFWISTNANKRSITLDIETNEGRDIFCRLIKGSDIVLESFDPGYMAGLGIQYEELRKVNPRIIMTSITPFGQTGPYSKFKGCDIVLWAMGGMMYLCGDPDLPPVQLNVPQAYFHGGIHGAVGSMMALYYREVSGQGQHVDVSIQEAVNFATMNADEHYDLLGINLSRQGVFYILLRPEPLGALYERVIWQCKGGYVSCFFRGGSAGLKKSAEATVAWMNVEGKASYLDTFNWDGYDVNTITQEERRRIEKPLIDFFRSKTKEQVVQEAIQRKLILVPLNSVKDLTESEQLKERRYWIEVEHPELGRTITYAGAPVKTSSCGWKIHRRAPLIGEHNKEMYVEELGFREEEINKLMARGVI